MADRIRQGEFIRWRRGMIKQLSPHFSTRERKIECSCGICAKQCISAELIDKMELVRAEYGEPIWITGGFRCQARQAALRKSLPLGHTAKGKSTHEEGNALDVAGRDMPRLLSTLEKYFKAIGIAEEFFHVDLRTDKVRRWKYE